MLENNGICAAARESGAYTEKRRTELRKKYRKVNVFMEDIKCKLK